MSSYGSAHPDSVVTIHSSPPSRFSCDHSFITPIFKTLDAFKSYQETHEYKCLSFTVLSPVPSHTLCVTVTVFCRLQSPPAFSNPSAVGIPAAHSPDTYSLISTSLFYSFCRYEITALTLPMIRNCSWLLQLWKDDSKERCHCKGDGLYLLKNALILTVQLAVQWQASMILKTGSPPKYGEKW